MSFSFKTERVEKVQPFVDCFVVANQAEHIACGTAHCNDALWDFVYDLCLGDL